MIGPGYDDGSCRSNARPGAFSAVVAALLLFGGAGRAEAQVNTDIAPAESADTTSGARSERRPLFSTGYLNRAIEGAQNRAATTATEVDPSSASEQARAAAYASRYGISHDLALQIIESALAEGLDPDLGFRIVRVESVFKANARGSSGSLGLTQLMPSTARAIDRTLRTDAQIMEPGTNLRTGFRYLRTMIERYDGDVRLAVLAYNRGETAVDRALRAGRDPENGYSSKVLGVAGGAGNRYAGKGVVSSAK